MYAISYLSLRPTKLEACLDRAEKVMEKENSEGKNKKINKKIFKVFGFLYLEFGLCMMVEKLKHSLLLVVHYELNQRFNFF